MASQQYAANILKVCSILQKRNVQCLLVGGTAVAFHGYLRPTTNRDGTKTDYDDFDFWYNPRYLNYRRVLDALEDLGLDMSEVREENFVNLKRSFFRHHFNDFTLDLIPVVGNNLSFEECLQRCHKASIGETEIYILSLQDLLNVKKASGREKDLEDVRELERIHGKQH